MSFADSRVRRFERLLRIPSGLETARLFHDGRFIYSADDDFAIVAELLPNIAPWSLGDESRDEWESKSQIELAAVPYLKVNLEGMSLMADTVLVPALAASRKNVTEWESPNLDEGKALLKIARRIPGWSLYLRRARTAEKQLAKAESEYLSQDRAIRESYVDSLLHSTTEGKRIDSGQSNRGLRGPRTIKPWVVKHAILGEDDDILDPEWRRIHGFDQAKLRVVLREQNKEIVFEPGKAPREQTWEEPKDEIWVM